MFQCALSIALCISIMLFIRAYMFTVFTVNGTDIRPELRNGDRVLVNRLSRADLRRGEYVVFGDSAYYAGRIVLVPGDTIVCRGSKYVIPTRCCKICDCKECRCYLITTGNTKLLVRHSKIIGRAYRIFPFR
ncbi:MULTISPECIES: signal peptidase I [Prevotellaceae]|nr:signal peptidase I [Prevotella phocaeensis]